MILPGAKPAHLPIADHDLNLSGRLEEELFPGSRMPVTKPAGGESSKGILISRIKHREEKRRGLRSVGNGRERKRTVLKM